jgi:cob(I)alamin adenosyltransferase
MTEDYRRTGYIQIYTGNGKGKTTAALGLAVRAAGAGLRVFFGQFIKKGRYSEIETLERLQNSVTVRQFGRHGFIKGKPVSEDVRAAERGLAQAESAVKSGDYDVVILDEANVAVKAGLFPVDRLLSLIDRKPDHVELVFTGRDANDRLKARAHLITEMKEIRHYHNEGVTARAGIEY